MYRQEPYTLKVTAQGFRVAELKTVTVEVNSSFTADIVLEVGDIESTVEVTASVGAELQRTDAQLGNVLGEKMIRSLPTVGRSTLELLSLQPATTPGTFGSGGTVSGARSDQNTLLLDGIDVSDNLTGGQGATFTQAPVGVDAISEFRVTVANPGASFGRSAGGQITLSSPRGSNTFRGVGYGYYQNDDLNANTWANNRIDAPKAELEDKRGGFSLGGPIFRNKTFFFANYEARRFPRRRRSPEPCRQLDAQRRPDVPRRNRPKGGLPAGDLDALRGCRHDRMRPAGPGAQSHCAADVRPDACWQRGGDGLNTAVYRGEFSAPTTFDTVSGRFDHSLSSRLQLMGRYSYQRNLVPQTSQLDISDPSNVATLRNRDEFGASVITGLDYQISSNWLNTFRFGWVQNKTDLVGAGPSIVGDRLGLPGTSSAIGAVGIDLSILNEAIDVSAQSSRTQITRDRNIQFSNRTIWLKGKHKVSFGGEFRMLPFLFNHNDQVTFLSGPIAALDSGSFLTIPATNRPPDCAGAVTTNCLRAADVGRWNDLYAVTLGMVDNVNIVGARDGSLQPLPLGTDLISDTTMRYFQFHFEDTWRMRPSLTLSYGLTYSWLTPLKEKLDRIALITDLNTGEVFSAESYLRRQRSRRRARDRFSTRRSACGRSTIRAATRSPIPTTAISVLEWPWRGVLPSRADSSVVSPGTARC